MNEIEIKHNFAKNVRELRISRNLNQIQLGEKIHYTSKAISKWENEDVLPDIVTLNMLAVFFNVTVDDLISNKSAVRKSHKKMNRILITISSCLLSFVIASFMFLILYLNHVPNSYKAFLVAIPCSGITFITLSALWFKRYVLNIAVILTIWGLAIAIDSFMNFEYFWIFIIVAAILCVSSLFFFHIRFNSSKDK